MVKLSYFPDTDTLYLDLSDTVSAGSREVFSNVIFEFDEQDKITGICFDNASTLLDIDTLRPHLEICTEPDHGRKSA